ncbi:hypothetical protein FRB94_005354 [Tulasnella sp. JGI-2019a]|nr:hypothetical protein FRB93_001952 [Tulasnella sp. JGI-2019a]KAG9000565.1 hypothetical protein FRB94_005354 [Tulasnella sp. JGI-2019a]
MPPPNRVLYDVAEQLVGRRAVKRDWYGNEIGRQIDAKPNPSAPAVGLAQNYTQVRNLGSKGMGGTASTTAPQEDVKVQFLGTGTQESGASPTQAAALAANRKSVDYDVPNPRPLFPSHPAFESASHSGSPTPSLGSGMGVLQVTPVVDASTSSNALNTQSINQPSRSYPLPASSPSQQPHAQHSRPFPMPSPLSREESQVPPTVISTHRTIPARVLSPLPELSAADEERTPVVLKASKVPSSALGRFFHYGSLAAGLTAGAATEYVRRQTTSSSSIEPAPPLMMSEANVTRLVNSLSQMRGAALKLGQFMSIQDAHVLPEQIERILRRVQNAAHYMPEWQMEQVMQAELGSNWHSLFETFDTMPIASASIGQVHTATLSSSSPFHPSNAHPGVSSQISNSPARIAVKIQFPNIQNSITSDIRTITTLLSRTTPFLPKGLFLGKTLDVFKGELADECDYLREASAAVRFGKLLEGDDRFKVPKIYGIAGGGDGTHKLTTGKVLAMEWMEGSPVGAAVKWEQDVRDEIARSVLVLCFRELFHFRFMQTDPNWSNFLYNRQTRQIELIDFGASREYTKEFMDKWYLLFKAAVDRDREAALEQSLALGYLLLGENEAMLEAHIQTMFLLGEPFRPSSQPNNHDGRFDFSSNVLPTQIRALIPTMLQNRLTPPPRETYSLNRKLSGAFLLCGRLRARVDCASIWEEILGSYRIS